MKTHDTIAGKIYTVTSPAGCTVTDETGLQLGTVEAGEQKSFVATGAQLSVDDDAARVTLTFKRAASVLRLLGGGVDKWGKYAKCTTNAEMAAINPDYRNDVDADGVWAWKLPNMVNFVMPYGGDYFTAGVAKAKKIKHLKLNLPKATGDMWSGVRSIKGVIETIELAAPLVTGFNGTFYDALAKKFVLNVPKVTSVNALLGWCPNARELHGNFDGLQTATGWFPTYSVYPPFTTVTCGFPSLLSGSGMFTGVQLNKDSALLVLGSIPAWTDGASHPLTIGIHVDHQTDEDVINAIAEAEAKGWTLTVQWNGTATAAAATTWGRRKPVYAKLGAPMEDGTPNLDWGHYVTDPDGYTEFASLEEAKEHFNITD